MLTPSKPQNIQKPSDFLGFFCNMAFWVSNKCELWVWSGQPLSRDIEGYPLDQVLRDFQ